jgi:hypothetical protein
MILLGQPPLPQGNYRGRLKIPPPCKGSLYILSVPLRNHVSSR